MDTPRTRRENEVWQACDDLWAQGFPLSKISLETITARLVELGYKKGSPNQIYQYRRSWKESRNLLDPSPLEDSHALKLTDPISRAVALVREELQGEATEKINQIQEEAKQRIQEIQDNYDQFKSQLHDMVQRLEQKEKALQLTEKIAKELNSELQQEKQAHKIAQTRADAHESFLQQYQQNAEKQSVELKTVYQERMDYLIKQLAQLTQTHREEISEFKNLMEDQRHRWIVENENLKSSCQQLEKEVIKMKSSEAVQKTTYNILQTEVTELKDTLSQLQEKNQQLIKSIEHHKKTNIIKENDLKHVEARETQKQELAQTLQQQLLEAKEKIGRLEEQLNQLKRERSKLTNKKTSTFDEMA